jgi:hypothetical protein
MARAPVCDNSDYNTLLAKGVVETGCRARARRKFVERHTAKSGHTPLPRC